MARSVKMCDVTAVVAAKVFAMLNVGIKLKTDAEIACLSGAGVVIVTDTAPCDLVYPEGWYYAKSCFTNKHNSSNGMYDAVYMLKTNGDIWDEPYCTRD